MNFWIYPFPVFLLRRPTARCFQEFLFHVLRLQYAGIPAFMSCFWLPTRNSCFHVLPLTAHRNCSIPFLPTAWRNFCIYPFTKFLLSWPTSHCFQESLLSCPDFTVCRNSCIHVLPTTGCCPGSGSILRNCLKMWESCLGRPPHMFSLQSFLPFYWLLRNRCCTYITLFDKDIFVLNL